MWPERGSKKQVLATGRKSHRPPMGEVTDRWAKAPALSKLDEPKES